MNEPLHWKPRPAAPGNYYVRGFSLNDKAQVAMVSVTASMMDVLKGRANVARPNGEGLLCDIHNTNTDSDPRWWAVDGLSDSIEFAGPLPRAPD